MEITTEKAPASPEQKNWGWRKAFERSHCSARERIEVIYMYIECHLHRYGSAASSDCTDRKDLSHAQLSRKVELGGALGADGSAGANCCRCRSWSHKHLFQAHVSSFSSGSVELGGSLRSPRCEGDKIIEELPGLLSAAGAPEGLVAVVACTSCSSVAEESTSTKGRREDSTAFFFSRSALSHGGPSNTSYVVKFITALPAAIL